MSQCNRIKNEKKKEEAEDTILSSFESYGITTSSNDTETLSTWRVEKNPLSFTQTKSKGIDPQSFHGFPPTHYHNPYITPIKCNLKSKTPSKLRILLTEARNRAILLEFSSYYRDYRNKLAAYKEVTSYKIWPLQELAFTDLDRLKESISNNENYGLSNNNKYDDNQREECDGADLSSNSSLEGSRCLFVMHSQRMSSYPQHNRENENESRRVYRDSFLSYLCNGNKASSGIENIIRDCKPLTPLWSMMPRIFAMEISRKGTRKYVVCHLGRFMDHYWRRLDSESGRHYYELIREGVPCRLYLDLEYCKLSNPHMTDHTNKLLMAQFISELCSEFQSVFDLHITRKDIINLDSSTANKFSRHLIVHLPNGCLFKDSHQCGIFVMNFIGRLAEEIGTGTLLIMDRNCSVLANFLFLRSVIRLQAEEESKENISLDKQENENTCFVDMGVYTRNRLFRLLGSTKFGKASNEATLRIADDNEFEFPNGFGNDKFFYPSGLESYPMSGKNDGRNSKEEELQRLRKAMDWEDHAKALAQTLVVPVQDTNEKKEHTPRILPEVVSYRNGLKSRGRGIKGCLGVGIDSMLPSSHREKKPSTRTGPSPFPAVDEFVSTYLANRGGVPGSTRSWTRTDHSTSLNRSTLLYNIRDNRYCEHIGRTHKSNGIMWMVSIERTEYWQKCYDPECRLAGFRGKVNQLPDDVKKAIGDVLLEEAVGVDVEFERALMELNLDCVAGGDDVIMNVDDIGVSSSVGSIIQGSVETWDTHPVQDDETYDPDFDNALNDALIFNPDLFP